MNVGNKRNFWKPLELKFTKTKLLNYKELLRLPVYFNEKLSENIFQDLTQSLELDKLTNLN